MNYMMDHVLHQAFKITLNITLKHGEKTKNSSIRIYVIKIEKRITFRINTINNDFQLDSRFLCTFVSNKSFGQLLHFSIKNLIFLKTFCSKFSYIEVWFTDQNSKSLEINNKINVILVINKAQILKNFVLFSLR